ncbi:hypothetical protein PSTG_13559 [Puccinia striiformis f. sp. tritici PST-78]|uniref:No apical meristem-associated C-terminal domain-containing protein n=1 Tax=Puccinia striiformis f. sp. tritici PST-78 TaxID=1165861 RepID=A0A0L0V191_9BASI|nr:hypothetical protein PSTG_13559 [Puccinia striiformis f. sp. tritici PST-78]
MAENTLDPSLDLLGSEKPLAASPTRTSPRKRKADSEPTSLPISKKNWSIEEDKALCKSWLETTRDAVVGTGQKSDTFWERIHKYYAELVEEVNEEKKNQKNFYQIAIRTVGSVECRWGHILKFLSEAKEMFKNQCRIRYNLDHCYVILKGAPKFQAARNEVNACETKAKTPNPKQSRTTPNTPSTSANRGSSPALIDVEDDEPLERSILGNERMEGQKAAKKKRADKESMGRIVHMQKELVQISRERLDTMKSAVQDAADEIVLSKDLDAMDGRKRAYYERKLQLIYDREDAKEAEEKKKIEMEKAKEEEEAKAKERKKAKAKADVNKENNSANVDIENEVEVE